VSRLCAACAFLLMLVVVGCARGAAAPGSGSPSTVADLPLLPTSAVPGIPATTGPLSAVELGRDASIRALASKVMSFGYVGGRERTFQGESRHLTLVVSRSLLFEDPAGAQRFVSFVRANAKAYFGTAVQTHQVVSRGHWGWLFTPTACACHLANPAFTGLVATGRTVSWLEINGPDASPALLTSLLRATT